MRILSPTQFAWVEHGWFSNPCHLHIVYLVMDSIGMYVLSDKHGNLTIGLICWYTFGMVPVVSMFYFWWIWTASLFIQLLLVGVVTIEALIIRSTWKQGWKRLGSVFIQSRSVQCYNWPCPRYGRKRSLGFFSCKSIFGCIISRCIYSVLPSRPIERSF